jgi:sulfur-oxidizing protein SoxY
VKRRIFLRSAGAVVAATALPAAAQQAFLPRRDLDALIAEVTGGGAPERSGVWMEIPALAENGNSVPLRIRVESPMTEADHVRSIHVLSERNPRPRIAAFHLGPASGRAEIVTRVRLAVGQRVAVVATLSGGRYRLADAEVVVTSAACLDEGA